MFAISTTAGERMESMAALFAAVGRLPREDRHPPHRPEVADGVDNRVARRRQPLGGSADFLPDGETQVVEQFRERVAHRHLLGMSTAGESGAGDALAAPRVGVAPHGQGVRWPSPWTIQPVPLQSGQTSGFGGLGPGSGLGESSATMLAAATLTAAAARACSRSSVTTGASSQASQARNAWKMFTVRLRWALAACRAGRA
jgi:hypothetical protein